MPSGEMLRVREVWHENLDAEMRIIEGIVEDYPFLAMDTEFPGVLALLRPGYQRTTSLVLYSRMSIRDFAVSHIMMFIGSQVR